MSNDVSQSSDINWSAGERFSSILTLLRSSIDSFILSHSVPSNPPNISTYWPWVKGVTNLRWFVVCPPDILQRLGDDLELLDFRRLGDVLELVVFGRFWYFPTSGGFMFSLFWCAIESKDNDEFENIPSVLGSSSWMISISTGSSLSNGSRSPNGSMSPNGS